MAGIDAHIQIDGVDDLMHRLTRAMAAATRAAPMQRLEQRLRERLQKYPPPPPSSTYVRTGDLGRGWAEGMVEANALGTNQYADMVNIELHNATPYAEWVQDPEHQAAVHQGRWETTQQAVDAETGPFLTDLGNSVEEALQ